MCFLVLNCTCGRGALSLVNQIFNYIHLAQRKAKSRDELISFLAQRSECFHVGRDFENCSVTMYYTLATLLSRLLVK